MTKIVASLCDGMSCGHLALNKLGYKDESFQLVTPEDKLIEYHTFEIDKYAEAVSKYRYPNAIRHGDARNWHQTHLQASYDCDLPGWNAW